MSGSSRTPLSEPTAQHNKQMIWRSCLDALLELEDGLTDWEVDFIDKMSKLTWFSEGRGKKIEQIYDERCG
jgi:hypothetical protein